MLSVNDCYEQAKMVTTPKLWITLQGRQDRGRIRQAGGFQEHSTERRNFATITLSMQINESLFQVPAHRAADTSTWQQYGVGGNFLYKQIIDTYFTEFVDQ